MIKKAFQRTLLIPVLSFPDFDGCFLAFFLSLKDFEGSLSLYQDIQHLGGVLMPV